MELEAVLIEQRHSFITSSKLYARNYVAIHYQTLFLVFYPVTTRLHLASILLVAKNWESLGLNISPKMIWGTKGGGGLDGLGRLSANLPFFIPLSPLPPGGIPGLPEPFRAFEGPTHHVSSLQGPVGRHPGYRLFL